MNGQVASPSMGLLPDTQNCGLRMRWKCRERFPRHRLQRKRPVSNPGVHHDTCDTHVPWRMSVSLSRGGVESVPGIPRAYATRNFAYLVRGPCWDYWRGTFLSPKQGLHCMTISKHMWHNIHCVSWYGRLHRLFNSLFSEQNWIHYSFVLLVLFRGIRRYQIYWIILPKTRNSPSFHRLELSYINKTRQVVWNH